MPPSLAYWKGKLVPRDQLAVSVDDPGFLLGVAVSERLRTFRGRLFRLPRHLRRLARSLEIIGLQLHETGEQLAAIAEQLVENNYPLAPPEADLGLVMFATPGLAAPDTGRAEPTVCLYTDVLPLAQMAPLYRRGQPLVVVDVRQVPAACWPSELKCRSRMHYYLADQEAARRDPGARALLLDLADHVSEASTANLLIYRRDEGLLSPPDRSILPGVTLEVVEELASQQGVPFARRDLTVEDVATASEILLCSTSPCLWPVLRFNGRAVGQGTPGPVFRQLLAAWNEMVGMDIVQQAEGYSNGT